MQNKFNIQEGMVDLLENAGFDSEDEKVVHSSIGELMPELWLLRFNLN